MKIETIKVKRGDGFAVINKADKQESDVIYSEPKAKNVKPKKASK